MGFLQDVENLKWNKEESLQSLKKVYQGTILKVEDNINWYTTNAKARKRYASWIRLFSLFLLGLGSILPIISDIWNVLPSSVASIVIAMGTGLLVFDRFMGYSTGWMRFLLAEMHLKARLEIFKFEWLKETINWADEPPSIDKIQDMISRCARFREEVQKVVQDETQLWVEEFQSSLRNLDENFQSLVDVTRVGALTIKIDNLEAYPGGWDLFIDDKQIENSKGSVKAVKDIAPGFRKVTVCGKGPDGVVIETIEQIVKIAPGTHESISIVLPAQK